MKRRVVNTLAKHMANPVMRRVAGYVPGWSLLETTGRRTGRPHRVPVGDGLRDGTFWIVAEHGRAADWVRNVEDEPRVRVRVRGGWRTGTAHVLESDDARARLRSLGGVNPWIVRAAGTGPLTVRVDLDPAPSGSRSVVRDGAVAGLLAGALGGIPSTVHAAARGSLIALLRAPGALVAPRAGASVQAVLGVPVHAGISAAWGVALAAVLPTRGTTAWGAVAGAAIGGVDILVVGRRLPGIRRLAPGPQIADHIAYGAIAGAVLARLRADGGPRGSSAVSSGYAPSRRAAPTRRARTRRSAGGRPNETRTSP